MSLEKAERAERWAHRLTIAAAVLGIAVVIVAVPLLLALVFSGCTPAETRQLVRAGSEGACVALTIESDENPGRCLSEEELRGALKCPAPADGGAP